MSLNPLSIRNPQSAVRNRGFPNRWMKLAIQNARQGLKLNHGGPFGACIVRNNKTIAVAHNTVLSDRDPTCHAEMNAIRKACKKIKTHDLSSCEIYSTSEPCPMCLTAIWWARLSKLYVGLPRNIAAAYGFDDANFYSQFTLPKKKQLLPFESGLMPRECKNLFEEWKKRQGTLY